MRAHASKHKGGGGDTHSLALIKWVNSDGKVKRGKCVMMTDRKRRGHTHIRECTYTLNCGVLLKVVGKQ